MSRADALLITRLGALGDVVMTLPAVRLLRRSLPDVRLAWLVEERHARILESNQDVDVLFRMQSYGWRRRPLANSTWTGVGQLVRQLRSERFQMAVDLQGLWKSAVWTYLSGAPVRVGLAPGRTRERASGVLLNRRAPLPARPHVTDLYLAAATEVIRLWGREPAVTDEAELLPICDRDRVWTAAILAQQGVEQFVAVHVGASWPTKRWPVDRLGRLVAELRDRGMMVVLPHAPDEWSLVESIVTAVGDDGVVPIGCDVGQLAAVCARAALFVGGDSGPYHIARAVGTPTVGLFGPTDPALNGPRTTRDRVVWGKVSCSPCYTRRCPTQTECMGSITVDAVVAQICAVLAGEAVLDGAEVHRENRNGGRPMSPTVEAGQKVK